MTFKSGQEIQIECPKTWTRVEGRENTFSQLVHFTNSKMLYNTAGIIELTVVSPQYRYTDEVLNLLKNKYGLREKEIPP